MEEEMKPWQKGYQLDYLKEITKEYDDYNKYTDSPFAQFKKNNVADFLDKGSLRKAGDAWINITEAKVRSKITMHGEGPIIGYKEPGDVVIQNISAFTDNVKNYLEPYKGRPCWLFVWAEHPEASAFATSMGFNYVGSKITTFAEIYSIYFRDSDNSLETRSHTVIDGAEAVNIKKCTFDSIETSFIVKELENITMEYTNHYSNYNKKGSWSAISLRGYRPDASFIAKPIEMSKKWKQENDTWEEWQCEDTPLREKFPYVNEVLAKIPTDNIERVRFMSLAPGGGELQRHTDQVDPHLGVADGKIMRLHIPIITNPNMEFTSWDMYGRKHTVNMKEGELWYLDIRKPHTAINNGEQTRIHLVVDVEANDSCRRLFTSS